MAVTGTARLFGLLGSIVRAVASVIGGLIIVHAVFVLFGANSGNVLVQFTAGIRDSFGWFTKNLFQPSDHKMGEAINDALAGFIWVFLGSLVAKFIARLAPASKPKDSKQKDEAPRSTPVQKSRPAEKPKDEPKQEAPKQEAPKQEAPKQEAPAPKEEAAPQARQEPKPEPEPEARPDLAVQAANESGSAAKHQAKDTARDEDRAEDKAQA